MKTKKYIMKKRFQGEPKLTDFEIIEEDLPEVKDGGEIKTNLPREVFSTRRFGGVATAVVLGRLQTSREFLCQAEYIAIDPYLRVRMPKLPEGSDMGGYQVAKILESKNSKYPAGSYISGTLGWRTHTVVNENDERVYNVHLVPELGDLPKSLSVGILGTSGNTAYFGLLQVCDPKTGETVAVTAAAGAVGSTAGQIARIKGCKVIGFAGSDAKCEWLTKELGFDHAINYKKSNIADALKAAAPSGVDCYFDNVGGELSREIMKQMNRFGRVAICGGISAYNADHIPDVAISQMDIITQQISIEGFQVSRWRNVWLDGVAQNLKWIQEGKLHYKEYVTQGFENIPNAMIALLRGENTGKAVVRL